MRICDYKTFWVCQKYSYKVHIIWKQTMYNISIYYHLTLVLWLTPKIHTFCIVIKWAFFFKRFGQDSIRWSILLYCTVNRESSKRGTAQHFCFFLHFVREKRTGISQFPRKDDKIQFFKTVRESQCIQTASKRSGKDNLFKRHQNRKTNPMLM